VRRAWAAVVNAHHGSHPQFRQRVVVHHALDSRRPAARKLGIADHLFFATGRRRRRCSSRFAPRQLLSRIAVARRSSAGSCCTISAHATRGIRARPAEEGRHRGRRSKTGRSSRQGSGYGRWRCGRAIPLEPPFEAKQGCCSGRAAVSAARPNPAQASYYYSLRISLSGQHSSSASAAAKSPREAWSITVVERALGGAGRLGLVGINLPERRGAVWLSDSRKDGASPVGRGPAPRRRRPACELQAGECSSRRSRAGRSPGPGTSIRFRCACKPAPLTWRSEPLRQDRSSTRVRAPAPSTGRGGAARQGGRRPGGGIWS